MKVALLTFAEDFPKDMLVFSVDWAGGFALLTVPPEEALRCSVICLADSSESTGELKICSSLLTISYSSAYCIGTILMSMSLPAFSVSIRSMISSSLLMLAPLSKSINMLAFSSITELPPSLLIKGLMVSASCLAGTYFG